MAPQNSSNRVDNNKNTEYSISDVNKHDNDKSLWVVINDNVYDLTKWQTHHPGGNLALLAVAGQDATEPFIGYHPEKVHKRLKAYQIGKLQRKEEAEMTVRNEFLNVKEKMEKAGIFELNHRGLYKRLVMLYVFLFSMSLICAWFSQSENISRWVQLLLVMSSAACLGLFWQQLAFTGHDAGHESVTKSKLTAAIVQFVATSLFGVSISWWKRNHNVHHIVTNSIDHDPDIQHLPFLSLAPKAAVKGYFSSYYKQFKKLDNLVSYYLVIHQHYLFYVVMCFARFYLYVQSCLLLLNYKEKVPLRISQIAAITLYFIWYYKFVAFFPDTTSRLLFLLVSHAVAGLLHVQITLSHFAMPVHMGRGLDLQKPEMFVRTQVQTSMDISCSKWMDWFHGGLQFQVTHHLYPRIPRCNLRRAREEFIEPMVKKLNMEYLSVSFFEANRMVIRTLYEAAQETRKHPEFAARNNYLLKLMLLDG